jgi:Magnesium chelatase, subunit ChlI
MLARRLTTILPAMRLAEALETTCLQRVAGRTGALTALVTSSPCRAPPQTISAVGLIAGGHVPLPGEVLRAHHGVLIWMNSHRSGAMCWRSCASRSRRVSYTYNFAGVLDLNVFATLAARLTTSGGLSRGQ